MCIRDSIFLNMDANGDIFAPVVFVGPCMGGYKTQYFSNMDANGDIFAPVVFVGPCMGGV